MLFSLQQAGVEKYVPIFFLFIYTTVKRLGSMWLFGLIFLNKLILLSNKDIHQILNWSKVTVTKFYDVKKRFQFQINGL